MKLLYEAPNTIEAHMILNMLEQVGLSARIDGEYLQGGVGELQAIGIIRVMIEEDDYADAKKIVGEWDANQPKQEVQEQDIKRKGSLGAGIIGFMCGAAAILIYYNTPVTESGIDYNGDGQLDERWTYVNYRLSKTELDRNFDGKIDYIYSFDRRGLLDSASSDEDFNETFETDIAYESGNAIWQKSDTNGDGFKDYKINFNYDLIDTITFLDPVTKKVEKIQSYGPFKLKSAKIDTTGDGVLDTLHEYDSIEEISKHSKR